MSVRFLSVLAVMLCCSIGNGEEIPLDQVWAWRMPGTQPMEVGKRAGKYVSEEGPLLDNIRDYLGSKIPLESRPFRSGFVVYGISMEALRNAHAVLIGNEHPQETFLPGEALSLVFFSFSSTSYVQLQTVELVENRIVAHYQFAPHQTLELTKHFALIPLMNLKPGKYQVDFVRLPLAESFVKAGWKPRPKNAEKLVCNSFEFTIEDKTTEPK